MVHESMVNFGVGAEVAATVQVGAFLHLQAPVKRIAAWTTHTGLAWEKYILPNVTRKCIIHTWKMRMLTRLRDLRRHSRDAHIVGLK
jgi:pyruvate/2-oxoglutarate/acetoin dehydrogenase E1 component